MKFSNPLRWFNFAKIPSTGSTKNFLGYVIFLTVLSIYFGRFKPHQSLAPMHYAKSKFHSKQWIQYFPELKRMETLFSRMKSFPTPDEITSAGNSTVSIINKQELRIGNTLEAFIQARDRLNRAKKYGGDSLRVILHRTEGNVLKDGVSCKIQDNDDGSYKAFCPLLWAGEAKLKVVLIHPSESVYMLMLNTTRLREKGTKFIAKVKNFKNGSIESVLCGFGFWDILSDSDVCDYSNPTNREPWFCRKPSSGICSPILSMASINDGPNKMAKQKITQGPYYVVGKNFAADVGEADIQVRVLGLESDQTNDGRMSLCSGKYNLGVTLDPNEPTGWFHTGHWRSFSCENDPYDPEKFAKCLANYTMYFLGDSTMRYFYRLLVTSINASVKAIGKTAEWSRPRNGYESKNNITLYYRGHGPPLHNYGTPDVWPYITDTLDGINATTSPAIVMLSIDVHMHLFDPDFYLHRIRGIRDGIISLKLRNPKIQVFIKGSHFYRQHTLKVPSTWFSYVHDGLVRNVLGTIEGVNYIPYWDMSSVLNNELVHAAKYVLIQQMGMFQSMICE